MYEGKQESKKYPGFYCIPTYPGYIVNSEGRVLNEETDDELNIGFYGWYKTVSIKGISVGVHRLLALAFLPEPDYPVEELDVNHIDGVKLNNSIDNLEWATRSENCLHAYKTGLRTDNVVVLVKDLRDGSIARYYSLQECARAFGLNGAHIHMYLKSSANGNVCRQYYVFIREGQEWPNLTERDIGKFRNGAAKAVISKLEDGSKGIIFESMGVAAEHFGIKPQTLAMHVWRNGEKPYNGRIFKYLDDPSLIDESAMIRRQAQRNRGVRPPVPIRVTDEVTGLVCDWESTEKFAQGLGVNKNTLQKGLWRTGGQWKNYRIEYLKEVMNSPARQ